MLTGVALAGLGIGVAAKQFIDALTTIAAIRQSLKT